MRLLVLSFLFIYTLCRLNFEPQKLLDQRELFKKKYKEVFFKFCCSNFDESVFMKKMNAIV